MGNLSFDLFLDEKCDKCLKNTEYFEYLILFKEIHEKEFSKLKKYKKEIKEEKDFKIKNILKKKELKIKEKILYEIIDNQKEYLRVIEIYIKCYKKNCKEKYKIFKKKIGENLKFIYFGNLLSKNSTSKNVIIKKILILLEKIVILNEENPQKYLEEAKEAFKTINK